MGQCVMTYRCLRRYCYNAGILAAIYRYARIFWLLLPRIAHCTSQLHEIFMMALPLTAPAKYREARQINSWAISTATNIIIVGLLSST